MEKEVAFTPQTETLRLARKWPEIWSLHRESGHLKRYKKPEPGSDIMGRWGDPLEHCVTEAIASRKLGELLGLGPSELELFEATA